MTVFPAIPLFACLAFPAQLPDLGQDVRLAKSVSVHLPIVSLSDFATRLQTEAGCPIRITASFRDLKVCALFKDRPLREAMEQLAILFDGEWIAEQGGYRFQTQAKALQLQQDLLKRESELQKEHVLRTVRLWIEGAREGLQSELEERYAQVSRQLAALPETDSVRRGELFKERDALLYKISGYKYGQLFGLCSEAEVQAYVNGRAVFWSTDPKHRVNRLPDDLANKNSKINTPEGVQSPSGTVAIIRFNFHLDAYQFHEQSVFEWAGGTVKSTSGGPASYVNRDELLADHPYRKLVKDWETPASDAEARAVLAKKLDLSNAPKEIESPYRNGLLTYAEQLEWLHKTSGIPILAEPFRQVASRNTAVRAAADVGSWIGSFMSETNIRHKPSIHIEKGWMAFRYDKFWRLRASEIPERLLTPLENAVARGRRLTINDYGTLALQLTPPQLASMSEATNRWNVCARFDTSPLSDAPHALRLWGALDQARKGLATGENGLSTADMNPNQLSLYREAMFESIWSLKGSPAAYLNLMSRQTEMRLFVYEAESTLPPVAYSGTGSSAVTVSQTPYVMTKGTRFVLGNDRATDPYYFCSFER